MVLSQAAQQLISKARIMSFAAWRPSHTDTEIALFQTADDQRLYLTDADLAQLRQQHPTQSDHLRTDRLQIVQQLRDQVTEIVDEAKAAVLSEFPSILEPGGGLYPPERAEACWRDFWHFLRCITYGIAGGQVAYTSPTGLEAMRQLYTELQVPLDAMVYGLTRLKIASLKRIGTDQQALVSPYFDHLIEQLGQFCV